MVSVGPVWYWSGMGIYVRILGLGGGGGDGSGVATSEMWNTYYAHACLAKTSLHFTCSWPC